MKIPLLFPVGGKHGFCGRSNTSGFTTLYNSKLDHTAPKPRFDDWGHKKTKPETSSKPDTNTNMVTVDNVSNVNSARIENNGGNGGNGDNEDNGGGNNNDSNNKSFYAWLNTIKNDVAVFHDGNNEPNNKNHSDAGFAGITHAMSTLATVTLLAALLPTVFNTIYMFDPHTKELPFVLILVCVVCTVGSCMLPDLDNTTSRAESALGFIGSVLSGVFRGVATFMQSLIKARRDDTNIDPHRGFWHSSMGWALMAFPVWLFGSRATPDGSFTLGNAYLAGTVFMLAYLSVHAVAAPQLKKYKGKHPLVTLLTPWVFAGGMVWLVWAIGGQQVYGFALPIAMSVFMGMLLHTFGDCHTASGAPIFAPFTGLIHKKVWWSTRFFALKSGGETEMKVLLPLYSLAAGTGIILLIIQNVM